MGISAILVAALTSTLHLATRTLSVAHSPSAESSTLHRFTRQWAADLRLALDFENVQSSAIRFLVPDRDGDGRAESIEYRWTGAPNNSIVRVLDLSADPSPAFGPGRAAWASAAAVRASKAAQLSAPSIRPACHASSAPDSARK